MDSRPRAHRVEDWVVLKYGWLLIFLVHLVFLAAGVREIKTAIEFYDPELLGPGDRRLDHVIQALYMWTLAFSVILLVLSVFVMEIFRTQRRILKIVVDQANLAPPIPVPTSSTSSTTATAPPGS